MVRSFINKWFVSKTHPYETETRFDALADKSCKYLLDVLFYMIAISLLLSNLNAPIYEVVPDHTNLFYYEPITDNPVVTQSEAEILRKEFHEQYTFSYWFLSIGLLFYLYLRLKEPHYRKRLKKKLKIINK